MALSTERLVAPSARLVATPRALFRRLPPRDAAGGDRARGRRPTRPRRSRPTPRRSRLPPGRSGGRGRRLRRARRLIDLFPPGASDPLRVDLFGDEIESLRDFDAASAALARRAGPRPTAAAGALRRGTGRGPAARRDPGRAGRGRAGPRDDRAPALARRWAWRARVGESPAAHRRVDAVAGGLARPAAGRGLRSRGDPGRDRPSRRPARPGVRGASRAPPVRALAGDRRAAGVRGARPRRRREPRRRPAGRRHGGDRLRGHRDRSVPRSAAALPARGRDRPRARRADLPGRGSRSGTALEELLAGREVPARRRRRRAGRGRAGARLPPARGAAPSLFGEPQLLARAAPLAAAARAARGLSRRSARSQGRRLRRPRRPRHRPVRRPCARSARPADGATGRRPTLRLRRRGRRRPRPR